MVEIGAGFAVVLAGDCSALLEGTFVAGEDSAFFDCAITAFTGDFLGETARAVDCFVGEDLTGDCDLTFEVFEGSFSTLVGDCFFSTGVGCGFVDVPFCFASDSFGRAGSLPRFSSSRSSSISTATSGIVSVIATLFLLNCISSDKLCFLSSTSFLSATSSILKLSLRFCILGSPLGSRLMPI